ncbi:hypothetical protein ES703_15539 [subsurface metagenome]
MVQTADLYLAGLERPEHRVYGAFVKGDHLYNK